MANIKITALNSAGSLAADDVLPVVDISTDETKKITTTNLFRTLPDGTAAAPALAFSSDQANGIYLAGTDTVGITTGGTQRVTVDASGNVIISGDLTVQGATTTVESTTVTIDDKNLELGSVATPTDTTADGGGITLKGATDKTISWVNSTDAWTLSEHVNIASAKEFRIAGTKVLDATSLGSAVVGSSLTSVGTIATGVWNGTALTSAYIGADAIDGTKIADDSINSEHYVDGSIDTAHIADSQITSAKILDGTIVNADVNASAAITGSKITTGTTSAVGVVQLTDSTSSTSTTTAATPNSVKTAFDLAGAALPKAGGTMTGAIVFNAGQTIAGYTPRTSATGSSNLSVGTTAQRDGSPAAGMIRYNSTLGQFEGYGSAWGAIGGGATGGGSDTWAVEHDNTITTSYTIGTGKNVISAGPLTVNSGATVTVPSGSNWVIA
jgi:hypothetical protein